MNVLASAVRTPSLATPFPAARFASYRQTPSRARVQNSSTSGRLQWARRITDDQNPLIARVYVNRIWHYLYGEGLVRTPDDFGHLGEAPSHPCADSTISHRDL